MKHWVVMEVEVNKKRFWAWCQVGQGPGFTEIAYTTSDGLTAVELEGVPVLQRHLFTVAVFDSDDPSPLEGKLSS